MDPSDGKELFRQARRLYQKRKYVDALGRFQAIDEAFPRSPDILHPLARCLIKLERFDEAREVHAFLVKVGDSRAEQIAERLTAAGGTPATPVPPEDEPPSGESDSGSPLFDVAFDSEDLEEATPADTDDAMPAAPSGHEVGDVPPLADDGAVDPEPDASLRTAKRTSSAHLRKLAAGRGALRAAGTVFIAQGGVTAFYALLAVAVSLMLRRHTEISLLLLAVPAALLVFAVLNFVAAVGVANGRRAFARILAVVSLIFIPAGTICGVTVLVNLAQSQAPDGSTG
jgi:Tetratricopeptide repeat